MGLHGVHVPHPLSVLPGLNGLCGWSINSVIQGVDSCSHVNVCSQACRRDGPRPMPLCLPWSLIRLEVNGGPCAEVAGARMEPPLTWRSHRGRKARITVTLVSVGPYNVAGLPLSRGAGAAFSTLNKLMVDAVGFASEVRRSALRSLQ